MGIRILASFIATFAAVHTEAASLPARPPLQLADLTVQTSASTTASLPNGGEAQSRDNRPPAVGNRWPVPRQAFAQEQRWVF